MADSDRSDASVRLAASLAAAADVEVLAVCITDRVPVSHAMGSSLGPGAEALLLPVATLPPPPGEELAAIARAAAADAGGDSRVIVREGTPPQVVPGVMADTVPDLLVLPDVAPRSRLAALLLGDDWTPLIVGSPVPVLLVRGAGAGPGTVLVVLEDPRPSGDAVRAVADMPLPADSRVVLLGLLPAGAAVGPARHRRRMIRRLDAARSMLTRAGRPPSVLVQEATSVADVLTTADRVEAGIVVAASSHLGTGHRLSDLADGLARRSARSVLIVPTSLQPRHRLAERTAGRGSATPVAGSQRSVI